MGNFASTAGAAFTPSDAFFLTEATRTGSLEVVQLFLKKNPALVYATDASDKSTPWHVAAASGHDVVLRVLIDTTRANALSNNFDPLLKVINKQNAKGQSPLMLACRGGHSICIRLLLESGAHLLVADMTGRSALHYAALHNGADGKGNDCVELLLAHMQQQLNAQGPLTAPPAVHANVIRKFADSADMYSRTALHCAAWSGNTRAVHALWAVGADICARTDTDCYDAELPCNNGTTPLHFAAMRGHQPVVVLLLAAWHRMVTRPSAPLPRPSFWRVPPLPPSRNDLEADQKPEEQMDSQPRQRHDNQSEAEQLVAGPGRGAGEADEPAGQEGDKAEKPEEEQALLEHNTRDSAGGDAGGTSGRGSAVARAAQRPLASTGGAADAPQPSSDGGAATVPPPSSDGGASGSSRRGRCSSSDDVPTAALLAVPLPPSPRPPPVDPRLMVDAYGLTPYTIACKRKHDHGSMLIELLDPATDFCAGDDDDRAADQAGNGGEGLSRRRGRGLASRDAIEDEDDGDDDDSEAAAGPLLLWEGVELIQDIAAEPESFFTLQQSAPLLRPQQAEDAAAAGGSARQGGGGRRSSGTSVAGRRRSSDGGSSILGGAAGSGGRGVKKSSSSNEMVPDCFLCPLTCQVFRDPVVAADGVTYEREAVERHLRHASTSPVTKQRLSNKQIYPNTALKRAIEHWTAGSMPRGGGGGDLHTGTGLIGRR